MQSACSFVAHAAPPRPWQGSICESMPPSPSSSLPHLWPRPDAGTAISRLRWRVPEHWSAHRLQSLQRLYWQSKSWTHAMPLLQLVPSVPRPSAGWPQWLPSRTMLRRLKRKPPSQLFVHSVQSDHMLHKPSTQCGAWQGSVLHGSVSSVSVGSHGLPPMVPPCSICFERLRWPPPHESEQCDHADHSAHLQSWMGHSGFPSLPSSLQPRASDRAKSQPTPPIWACVRMARFRSSWPVPHVVEHELHSDQVDTRQGCTPMLQGCVLHCMVSHSGPSQPAPPYFAGMTTLRCLMVCPPSHVLSHRVHPLHSAIWQSTGSSEMSLQAVVSASGSLQASPAPSAGETMMRRRIFCCPLMHDVHSDQSPSMQLALSTAVHGSSPHPRFSCTAPSHGRPPFSALVTMVRRRVCWPPPHFFVHWLHSI
mmetsp:Transcript_77965/g.200721  ORF Transcript_77965/g.200721 Transcript_77965/m.200721 type:complete len:422 (+) Transcript_77965:334-1599(+)